MFNFKKISAVLTSVVMIGSSVGIAAAANYPAPFISSGNSNVAIVFGTGQGVSYSDMIYAGNIQADLQSRFGSSGGGTTTVTTCAGGDCYLIEQASSKLNMNSTYTGVKSTSYGKSELPNVLNDLTYISGDGKSYGYTQSINFYPGLKFTSFTDSDYNDEKPSLGTKIAKNDYVLNYTITWKKQPQSQVGSDKHLTDFEDSEIEILGKTYSILSAKNSSENSGQIELTLMGGSGMDTVNLNEVKSVTVNNATYAVRASSISSSNTDVCISIDSGEEKCYKNLGVGETRDLSNSVQFAVKDINYNAKAGIVDNIEFSIGAEKLVLKGGEDIKINDETIDGFKFNMTQTPSGSKEQLGTMTFTWRADEDFFIADSNEVKIPGLGGIKIASGGFNTPKQEIIKVTTDGNNAMKLEIPLKDGAVDVPLLYGNETTWTNLGSKDSKLLVTTNGNSITFNESHNDEYFVASWNSSTGYESYLLTVSEIKKTDGINYTTIKRIGYKDSSSNNEVCSSIQSGSTCTIGNVVLTTSAANPDDKSVTLTINSGSSFDRVYSAEGMSFRLPVAGNGTTESGVQGGITLGIKGGAPLNGTTNNATSWVLTSWEEDKNGNLKNQKGFNMTLGWSGGKTRVSSIRPIGAWASDSKNNVDPSLETEEDSDKYVDWLISDLATKVQYNKPSGSDSQYDAEITYPSGESYGLIYLAAENAEIGRSGESTTTTVTTSNQKLGEILVKDSEVSNVADKNLIIVGGSCINSAAAKALGVSSGACGEAFTTATGIGSGQFLIQSVGDVYATGKIALVVAGYNVADTQNAQQYLTTRTVDTTSGKKYKGTSATSAELVTDTQ